MLRAFCAAGQASRRGARTLKARPGRNDLTRQGRKQAASGPRSLEHDLYVVDRAVVDVAERAQDSLRRTRRRDERVDSVDEATLHDREMHALRMESVVPSRETDAEIKRLRLGRKKGSHSPKRAQQRRSQIAGKVAYQVELLGKAGFPARSWDRLNVKGLPEVAIFGHSNCGKSALLNALSGVPVRKGAAEVDSRAGWTAELGFYSVRRPVPGGVAGARQEAARLASGRAELSAEMKQRTTRGLVLVDTPGYGFAVGSGNQLKEWSSLLTDYLTLCGRLSFAMLLVDCTRGLCAADRRLLKTMAAAKVSVLPVLTKTDLLAPEELACSHALIQEQLEAEPAASEFARIDEEGWWSLDTASGRVALRASPAGGVKVDPHTGQDLDGAPPPPSPAARKAPPLPRGDRPPQPPFRPRPLMISSHHYAGIERMWAVVMEQLVRRADRADAALESKLEREAAAAAAFEALSESQQAAALEEAESASLRERREIRLGLRTSPPQPREGASRAVYRGDVSFATPAPQRGAVD